ncbi:phosphoglucosamine mutase [Thermopirellula anaerolimosa]
MSELIISVSGLRGVIGRDLSPETAIRYVAAWAAAAPPGPVIVGRDGRTTGRMLLFAVQAALMACGRHVLDADVVATPTMGLLVRHYRAAGGVQITASHNPPEYNGLKLFSSEGRVIPAQLGEEVRRRFYDSQPQWLEYHRVGTAEPCPDKLAPHLDAVLRTVDVDRIRKNRYRVLLDSNHGAGGVLGIPLLEALGCEVIPRGSEPNGLFEHPAEPLAENLTDVGEAVRAVQADIGFCQDPDADRLAIIDASGRYLGEEYTLAICVDHRLKTRRGPIVANCATSRMSRDLAAQYGVPFYAAAVGEANVVDAILEHQAVFGGEGNGGPIDPTVGLVRDSFVGMACVLDAMASEDLPVADLADRLPRYSILKTKVPLPREKLAAAYEMLTRSYPDAKTNRLDGLRLDWPDRWVLLRPSNTEPIVRVIAESPDEAETRNICEDVRRRIEAFLATTG